MEREPAPDNASNGQLGRASKQRGERDTRTKHVGFQFLLRLAQSDSKEILSEYNKNKNAIMVDILQKPIEHLDLFPLILEIASKVCTSNFPQLKLEFILGICNSSFVSTYLMLYLSNLPYVERKRDNSFYWGDQEKFWENLIVLLETITAISPSTAMAKCRALIENISKGCIESLKERHNFDLPEEYNQRLQTLRNSLAVQEKEIVKKVSENAFPDVITEEQPPTSFRELPLLPTKEDLLETKPFVRPNIVKGAYSDVDHYLDVQFRLLREDCFGPIREGIQQYLKDPTRRHYDGIRVFHNVTFAEPYVSSVTFGNIIEVDKRTKQSFRSIKWEYNKRFLFGGLVLLTKDNCKSFVVATIADREPKYLSQGKIPVAIINETGELDFNNAEKYLMIESEVYFEPYYHVLKVLQDTSFPEHLAMKKYIVDVENSADVPKYVSIPNLDFILPTAEETGLNESQYEAFKLAITHEFAVIQGPPGTGKTYMGVEVAKYLLRNVRKPGCLLLIICYTNHALDQFLEAILKITNSIVRIGGQSRLEIMKEYNLNNIRNKRTKTQFHSLYYDKKDNLRNKVRNLKQLQSNIASLDTGIVSSKIMNLVDESKDFCRLIVRRNEYADYLRQWLFEKVHCDYTQPIKYDIDYLKNELSALDFTKNNNTTNVEEFDDELNINDEIVVSQICTWSLEDNYKRLFNLLENLSKSKTHEEEQTIRNEIKRIETNVDVFKQMRSRWEDDEDRDVAVVVRNPWQMPIYNRWKLYFQWTIPLKGKLLQNITILQEEAVAAKIEYDEARMILDLELIKNHNVVGMTTTGAARLQKMIRELAPPIIIVEEAAEVLEQHIVTSLHKMCQHLILIGDQQQLRPSAACMRLARHYNIEVSLFERMINNKMHSRRLAVQHRMRPDFAALLCPHIYPDLSNHASVENLPNVRGITKNLFFFTHDHKEESGKDSTSKLNSKEADIALRLANYLMQQGYGPEDVTILCAYAAQMFYMKREKKQYIHLDKVKVTVVDNYQGEESKIIILSLVRNNLDNKVGFLATPNRICVALSRAKEGFYIFGNIEMLKSQSELWRNISVTLEEKEAVGSSLQLQCYFHPEQITKISSDVDFDKCPEGGCLLKCNLNLSCGHSCPYVCHAYDRNHENIKCIAKCERILCELQHVCPLRCAIKCDPCKVVVNKHLPCGHNMDTLCSMNPKDVKCMTTVTVTLPHCGHESQKACFVDVNFIMCSVPCEARLMCGHVCQKYCHVKSDPDHEKTTCEKPCTKQKKGCTFTRRKEEENVESLHQCQKMCFEGCDECRVEVVKRRKNCKHTERVPCNVDVEASPCHNNCARLLACGHHCKRKCHEPCGGCKQLVKKEIPNCKHTIKIECSVEPTKRMCIEKCKTILGCGHICPKLCKERCDANECNQRTNRKVEALCGHEVYVPCKLALHDSNELRKALLEYCESPCESVLGCQHPCKGSCSKCCQGRLHAPCAAKCDKDLICGHRCVEPCNEICPPCDKPCEVRCPHSKCANKCGRPCVSCKEKCVRNCEHGKCIRLCGQPCSVPACSAPCPRTQSCGHRCRGLCGHPCPSVCRLCDPQHFPKDFLGEDYEDDAILVLLEDCNHVMEVEELDTWMSSKMETIGIKSCPKCRKPILMSYRYKDLINKMLKNDINPVKEKVYGTKHEISLKLAELNAKIQQLMEEMKEMEVKGNVKAWMYACSALLKHKDKCKLSLMQIEMYLIYCNILEILRDKKIEYFKLNTTIFVEEFTNEINVLGRHLARNVKKISHQQQQDIEREINRVHAILQFAKLVEHPYYKTAKAHPDIAKAFEDCKKIIFGIEKFIAEDGLAALTSLQEQVKANGVVVTAQERAMVVKAIGLKAGHWFKCPNGHVYCIGECGGAMEVAQCPDCGERIGGSQHALLASNSHASEMDNSRFPAWSEQYNNLNNFRFD